MARKGRPLKSGARKPCGRLHKSKPEPSGPTKEVLAKRRAILGRPDAKPHELRAAENPLDTMAERGWLEPSLARAGHAYAELYRIAGIYLSRVTANMDEAPETAHVDGRRVRDWSPEEIAAVWAVIERRKGVIAQSETGDDGDAEANARLKRIWTGLGPKRSAVVNAVCVAQSWPLWSMQAVAGRELHQIPEKWLRDKHVLTEGLLIIRAVISPTRSKAQAPERDHPFLSGPVVEERVEYVDDEGQPDPIVNRAGFKVEVLRRRRA